MSIPAFAEVEGLYILIPSQVLLRVANQYFQHMFLWLIGQVSKNQKYCSANIRHPIDKMWIFFALNNHFPNMVIQVCKFCISLKRKCYSDLNLNKDEDFCQINY
jgi:hypothetical protein